MKVHWFQHVPFEGLGVIEGWLAERGHTVTRTRFWAGDTVAARHVQTQEELVAGAKRHAAETAVMLDRVLTVMERG